MNNIRLLACASAIVLLSACGGGGGGSDDDGNGGTANPPPATPNPSPTDPVPDPDEPPTPTDPGTPNEPPPPSPPPPPPSSLPGPVEPVLVAPSDTAELNCATCQTTFKDMAIDSNGVPTVVWAENNNGTAIIRAARYNAAAQAWDRQTIGIGTPSTVQVGADRAGNVKAAWLAGNAFNVATFSAATGTWSPPLVAFEAPNIQPAGPKTFVVGPNGHMYFAYILREARTTPEGFPVQTVGAWVFNATNNTTQRVRVGASTEHVNAASIDVDDPGNAVLTWSTRLTGEEGAFRGRIYTSRFRPTNNYWGRVREQAPQGAYNPQVSLRQNGRAVLVYGVTSNGVNDLLMRQYDPEISLWSGARSVGQMSPLPAIGLAVDTDQTGNAFIAWSEATRGQLVRRYDIAANSFTTALAQDDGTDVTVPDISVNQLSGNALHAYVNSNAGQGTTNVVRFGNTGNQLGSSPLNTGAGIVSTADVAMGPGGVGYAAWTQATGQTDGATPVQNLRVRRIP